MRMTKLLVLASISGVVLASTSVGSAAAWHPRGVIKKSVQNQTSASGLSDANTKETAVTAKPGDTLKYVIEVSNTGEAGQSNEMHFTALTDTLPENVQLISDPAKRTISEDLGVIKPGEKKTKEYLVKVTASKDTIIENKACFKGNSSVNDNPQEGCDVALVTVTVPKEEPKPTPTPTPEPPKNEAPTPPAPVSPQLPQTGASASLMAFAAAGSSAVAYAGRLLVVKRRQQ